MTTAPKTTKNLREVPLISFSALARELQVGSWATKAAAMRLGITAHRYMTGREALTFTQAEAVAQELASPTTH